MPDGPPMLRRAALLFLLLAPLLALDAAGHASPTQVSPSTGSVVQAPPREVVIAFTERLEPAFSRLEVRDANGTIVSEPSRIDDDGVTMRAALPRGLAYGAYSVTWRALSVVDGHSTRGLTSFLFPDPSKPLDLRDLPSGEAQQEALVGPHDIVLRAATLLGIVAALGTAVLALVVVGTEMPLASPGTERRLGLLAASGALVAALATIVLAATQAGAATGSGFAGLAAQPGAIVGSTYGRLAAARAPLLVLGAALAWFAARRGAGSMEGKVLWLSCAVALGGAIATISLSSHAAALRGAPALAIANDAVHFVAAAAWVGGLAGLGYVLYRAGAAEATPGIAQRFSTLATVGVVVVVLTGTMAAILQIRSFGDLVGSLYGQLVLAKVALVAVLAAFGARHKFRLVPEVARAPPGDPAPAARFGRSVRYEALLGVAVLVVAGALTAFSPPAPAVQSAPPAIITLSQTVDGVNVTLLISPSPLVVGPSTFDLFLTVGGVSDANATGANLTLRPPDRSLGDGAVPLQRAHVGHFAGEGAYFTMPGTWTLRVSAQRAGAFDVVTEFQVQVEGGA